jgi:hypothetical protein
MGAVNDFLALNTFAIPFRHTDTADGSLDVRS